MGLRLLVLVLAHNCVDCVPIKHQERFGKYFSKDATTGYSENYEDSQYYLYTPSQASAPSKFPVVFQIFGSGYTHNPSFATRPFKTITPAIKGYNDHGIAFLSTGYRLLDRTYWYHDAQGLVKEEELIHIDKDGKLTLDENGRTMTDYKVQMSFMEKITKCMFDVVQSLEHLIAHADEFNVDVHRMVFLTSSAGASQVNYLSHVYHEWNVGRFSPVGAVLAAPQFNLPGFGSALDVGGKGVWKDFLDHMQDGITLSDVVLVPEATPFSWCKFAIACPIYLNVTCNASFNLMTWNRYCTSEAVFDSTTVAQIRQTNKWDESIPEFGSGLEKLWLTGKMMLQHTPQPYHIFVQSDPFMVNFMHHPMFVQQYAEHADQAGINYTAFYLPYKGMRTDLPELRHAKEKELLGSPVTTTYTHGLPMSLHYVSSTGWRNEMPAIKAMDPGDVIGPHMPFICFVTGVKSCAPTSTIATPALDELPRPGLFRPYQGHGAAVICLGIAAFILLSLVVVRRASERKTETSMTESGDPQGIE